MQCCLTKFTGHHGGGGGGGGGHYGGGGGGRGGWGGAAFPVAVPVPVGGIVAGAGNLLGDFLAGVGIGLTSPPPPPAYAPAPYPAYGPSYGPGYGPSYGPGYGWKKNVENAEEGVTPAAEETASAEATPETV